MNFLLSSGQQFRPHTTITLLERSLRIRHCVLTKPPDSANQPPAMGFFTQAEMRWSVCNQLKEADPLSHGRPFFLTFQEVCLSWGKNLKKVVPSHNIKKMFIVIWYGSALYSLFRKKKYAFGCCPLKNGKYGSFLMITKLEAPFVCFLSLKCHMRSHMDDQWWPTELNWKFPSLQDINV